MSRNEAPLVVASVLNWNTAAETSACVRALLRSDYRRVRIVIVDNNSADDSVAVLRQRFPTAIVVALPGNLGFASGHFAAVQLALEWQADAVWLVNSDAIVEPDALSVLVDAWQATGDGLFGCLPLARDVDGYFANFPSKFIDPEAKPSAFRRDERLSPVDLISGASAVRPVGSVVGCGMLIPLRVIGRHGWMDEKWFMYCEELDYCLRLRAVGVNSYLVPRSQLWHVGGGSARGRQGVDDCLAYYRSRNEIALAKKHGGRWVALMIAIKKALRALYELPLRPARAAMLAHGMIDGAAGRFGKTFAPEATARKVYPALHSHALGLTERLFRHLRRYGRQPPAVERCGLAWIWFECEPPVHVREYYRYCVQLFRNALLVTDQRVDLVFGDCVAAGPDAKRVMFQLEHTLVKPGGRDSQHASAGSVAQPNSAGEYYLVRIDNQAALSAADVIVEYSQPNVENIVRAGIHAAYVSKMICLAPLLYAPSFGQSSRQNEAISTFADLRQQRRASLLQKARREGVPLRNVRGVYDGEALRALYQNTKLLINVHQTDHHHTFEELRVLPALLCGVIVVSETVPLRQQIPYQRFIVWADYGELVATTRQILADYDDHWRRIFCDPSLIETLEQMRQRNEQAVALALHRLDRAPGDSGITDSVRQV